MTDALFGLVSDWGIWAIALAAYLSCLALPVPTSALMLAGGAFVASGDLKAAEVWTAAFVAAVAGDQTGYAIGRGAGARVLAWLGTRPARAALIRRAEAALIRRGGLAVFLSTWAVAPLGPWVNLAAGAAGMRWWRYTLWDMAGEAVWVTLYTGLGYAFATRLDQIAGIMADLGGFLTALAMLVILGLVLRHLSRRGRDRG